MRKIRLKYRFTMDHCEIPAGTEMTLPAGIAERLIRQQAADLIEPEKAVVEPEETRVINPPGNRRRKYAPR